MVSIGALRYDIIADTQKFTSGIVATRRELTAARRLFRETRTPAENLGIEIEGVNRLFKKGAIDTQTYNRSLKALKQQHLIAQGGVRGTIAQLKTMPSHLSGVVKGFVAYRAAGIAAGQIRDAFSIATELESTKASFAVLTGSAERANRLVEQLRQYDLQTTFNFADTTHAAQTLLNFGVSLDNVLPNLRQLGDISLGDSNKLRLLSKAFGDVKAKGRLTGEEVRQFVNSGLNPLQEISRMTGQSMADLTDQMAKGQVSFEMVSEAIASATSEGGRFFGMVEKRADTTAGKLELLRGEWDMLKADFATELLPALNHGIAFGHGAIDFFTLKTSFQKSVKDGILAYDQWANSLLGLGPSVIGNKPSQQVTASQIAERERFAREAKKRQEEAKKKREEKRQAKAAYDSAFGSAKEAFLDVGQGVFGSVANAGQAILGTGANAAQAFSTAQQIGDAVRSYLSTGNPRQEIANRGDIGLAPTARRGSREEYEAIAKITGAKQEAAEERRHKEASKDRESLIDLLNEVVDKIGDLSSVGAV